MSDPSAPTPAAGLRGLLPFDPAKHARFHSAAEYGFTFTPPTYPIDKTAGITAWGMDGNGPDPTLTVNGGQPVGDCGPCAVPAHANMLTAALAGLAVAGYTMTADQVVTLYFEHTGGQDTGVDLGDWLLWLFNKGLIEGFVKVDLADLDSALATFDVVIVGVSLNTQADAEVNNGQPWDVGPGNQPDPTQGHAILYLTAQSPSGPFGWCTWGITQPSTLAWKQACPQQAFAVLTRPEAAAKGFPFAQLLADLLALGGTGVKPPPPIPVPVPVPPAPKPPPPPVPVPPAPGGGGGGGGGGVSPGCLSISALRGLWGFSEAGPGRWTLSLKTEGAAMTSPTLTWLKSAAQRVALVFLAAFLGPVISAGPAGLFHVATIDAATGAGLIAAAIALEALVANVINPTSASSIEAIGIRYGGWRAKRAGRAQTAA